MVLWYTQIQDVFLKKPCKDATSKFGITKQASTVQESQVKFSLIQD